MHKKIKLSNLVLPAYYEFWKTKKTYVVCKGARASGKSKAAALWHIYHMMKYPLANTLCVRKTGETLRDSVFSDLKWAIEKFGVGHLWKCTTSPLEMVYLPTGQKILFRGLDSGYKVTSISVPTGVLCWLMIEEAYEIMIEDDFNKLDESIRGILPEGYWKRITVIFNPWSERIFWKKRFFDTKYDDVLSMTTTYEDNPYLSNTDLKMFERMKLENPRRYKVAGKGEWGIIDGLVYENWEERAFDIKELLSRQDIETAFGLDYGYTNDPAALFCGAMCEKEKTIYVFDEFYKKGMSNKAIYNEIVRKGYSKERITADNSEQKSNDELRSYGLKTKGALKGPDSINYGIQFIQDYKIVIHTSCVNFLTEISNYQWDKDKFGTLLNKPVDDFNHLMDAMRYALEDRIRKNRIISMDKSILEVR